MRLLKPLLIVPLLCLALLLGACSTQTQAVKATPTPSVSAPAPSPTPSPTAVVPTPTATPTPVPARPIGAPVRLQIPAIGVNASIEDLGLTAQGDLATPAQSPWEDVGWYKNGPRPGEEGSAVINGHLDRPGGYPAVFWNLRELGIGASVMVLDAHNKLLRFRVVRVASYAPASAPLQEIFGTTGGTYLNLITCAGTWIPAQSQTTLRLVVYTELV